MRTRRTTYPRFSWHRLLFALLLLAGAFTVQAQQNKPFYPLIPYPVALTADTGFFIIHPSTRIIADSRFSNEAGLLGALFASGFGKPLQQAKAGTGGVIRLVYDASVPAAEGYRLRITPREVRLSAATPAGIFRGTQTIRQLLPATVDAARDHDVKELPLPALRMEDRPAYAWRGIHIDVARHFFSIGYLQKLIDLIALYKLNKLHLHLTDDQGWRIEIKKYPKLTGEGAWRTWNSQDSACMQWAKDDPDFVIDPEHVVQRGGKTLYGGFYTQRQMKSLVAYAAARHIDIIPEVDMPGHMMAAIRSYTYLSCDGKIAFGSLFSSPICPCMPTTFQFARDVFTEIMEIFPSEYIHIGGDEVDRTFWGQSEECRQLMTREGLKSTAELQAWFIREMEKFFTAHGRKLIGWDEILEGGVSPTAAVMYWRTWVPSAPATAARNGNKVIMTPGNPLYFSERPDGHSLQAVYGYDPVPKGLGDTAARNIMGLQANLWSEWIPSERRADYLLMPRMTALADRAWTNGNDYAFYLRRLQLHYPRLDGLKVNYRLPDLPLLESYAFTDQYRLDIKSPLDNLTIRYTLDSTLPDAHSKLLTEPLLIGRSSFVRLAFFKRDGTRGDVYGIQYKKQDLAVAEASAKTRAGLICSWRKKSFQSALQLAQERPDSASAVPNIVVPKEAEAPSFGLRYEGYIDVPADDIYTFYFTCDDGGILQIAGREVVNNDGLHPPKEKGGQVALSKGLHAFGLDFIEGGGGYTLKLQYSRNGGAPQDIPDSWFRH